MTFRDAAGNSLNEGDLVVVGAQGIIIGTVQKASGILSADPNMPPVVEVGVIFPIPAMPNGMVSGLMKIAKPQEQKPMLAEG